MTLSDTVTRGLVWARGHAGRGLLSLAAVGLAVLAGPRLLLGPRCRSRLSCSATSCRPWWPAAGSRRRTASDHRRADHRHGARVPVREGQDVAAGAVLVELESAELRAALNQADLAVQQAQARLRQLREVQAPVAEQALRQAAGQP